MLREVGFMCFRDLVYQEMKINLMNAVLSLIDREREGKQIYTALLQNVLDVCTEIGMGDMNLFRKKFDEDILQQAGAYYSRKVVSWILQDSFFDYMVRVEKCLKQDEDTVTRYLSANCHQNLLEIVPKKLLLHHMLLEKLQHSGFDHLFMDHNRDYMSGVYRLYGRIRGLGSIANLFERHLIREGTTMLKEVEDALSNKAQTVVSVHNFIELHHKYITYIEDVFHNNSVFCMALKRAFTTLCTKKVAEGTVVELLATVCHDVLKKLGSESFYDGRDVDSILEKVMKVFAYVSDKDLFAKFYMKDLASRLLLPESENDSHELSMLSKLKQQCGYQFTLKMERMVTDSRLARENQTSFKEYLSNNPSILPGIDLTVTVLNTTLWPSYKSPEFNLPVEMVKCVNAFKEFYATKPNQHKLTWIYSMGNCIIKGNFDTKPIEMEVTTYQAAILLLYNVSEKLSYSEVKSKLNLTDEVVVGLLNSLTSAKYKILLKDPSREGVVATDNFEFNANFTNRMKSIKIPLPTVNQKKKTIQDVERDRRCEIDILIVRIMKKEKVLSHQELASKCIEQLPMFKLYLQAIKKRAEDLITREYIEPDRKNPNILRYLP